MDIKLLTKEQDTIRFVLSDVSPAFANALRRIILAEVPVMAIEDVMILENSSVMYDEILAHRLGLIPITTDQSYNLPEECTCKSELGCEKCRASLSLEVEASDPVEVVYTSNLKPENPEVKKTLAVAQPEEIVDASNLILGRMASYVAKKALDGKSMVVINAERAVISGTKERVVARAKLKLKTRTLGNLEKSPTHPRKPDGYVR